ncbi:MAG: hypothetical protein PHX43_02055 [Alphaproteobacteria bacterium]|nr:hypothetical protein [Alphaproteobacteria bacterium]
MPDRSPFIFRGHFISQNEGDVLHPAQNETASKKGSGLFVFATYERGLAEAYGLKQHSVSISLFNGKDGPFPLVILCMKDGISFDELLQGETCLQTLSSESFEIAHADRFADPPPSERVSEKPVKVLKVEIIKNYDLLRHGVQVFTVDGKTAQSVANEPFDMGVLARGIKDKTVTWENLRPDYDDDPLARQDRLYSLLELEKPNKATRTAQTGMGKRIPQNSHRYE